MPEYTREQVQELEKELEEYYRFIDGLKDPPTFFTWKKYYKK